MTGGLWALALGCPLLSLLAEQPAFLEARHLRGSEIVGLLAVLLLGLPAVPTTICLMDARLRTLLEGLALTLLALPMLADLPAGVVAGLAPTLGVVLARRLAGQPEARQVLAFVLPAGLLLMALQFLLVPEVAGRFGASRELVSPALECEPVPVVLVVFDEFPLTSIVDPRGEVDGRLFPNLRRLADGSTWYRRAHTTTGNTMQALPDLVGQLPAWLRQTHRVVAFETITEFAPHGRSRPSGWLGELAADLAVLHAHRIAPRELSGKLPRVDQGWGGFVRTYDNRYAEVEQAFGELSGGGGRPLFFLLHSMLPHAPWSYLGSGTLHNPRTLLGTQWQVEYQLHLTQVQAVDTLVGTLLQRLRESGLHDRSLVIVTADHGQIVGPVKKTRSPDPPLGVNTVLVPLFIKFPGQTLGRVDDRLATLVDLGPTVAEVLGLPWKGAGHSLLGPPKGESERDLTWTQEPGAVPRPLPIYTLATLLEGAERKYTLFPESLFCQGTGAELLDRPAAASGAPAGHLRLLNKHLLADVDPEGPVVPCLIEGELSGVGEGAPLAVAVNGIVRAVTPALPGPSFCTLVPAQSLQPGRNRIDVFAVKPGRLARLVRVDDEGYRLQDEVLHTPSGTLPLETGPACEVYRQTTGLLLVRGRAPGAREVLMFDDEGRLAGRSAVGEGGRFVVRCAVVGDTLRAVAVGARAAELEVRPAP